MNGSIVNKAICLNLNANWQPIGFKTVKDAITDLCGGDTNGKPTSLALDIDYDKVIEYARYDDRLGNTHWAVPGPDGDFGYGGHCFPKDMSGLRYVANELGVKTTILDAAIEKNKEVRTDKDWEKQIGRAVSED